MIVPVHISHIATNWTTRELKFLHPRIESNWTVWDMLQRNITPYADNTHNVVQIKEHLRDENFQPYKFLDLFSIIYVIQ